MENIDLGIIQKDLNYLKKAVEEIRANVSDVEMIKAFFFCHRPCPDPEGEFTEWAKKELEEVRKTPDENYISMEEIQEEFS